jgi:hypothetical protein
MAKFQKVQGNTGLIRDKTSGAILNINTSEATRARIRKYERAQQKEKDLQLKQEVESIKQDVSEIKDLLNRILEVSNGSN